MLPRASCFAFIFIVRFLITSFRLFAQDKNLKITLREIDERAATTAKGWRTPGLAIAILF